MSYKEVGEKFKTVYTNRFEEGEFRKRVQFMYAGELYKFQFRYTGRNKEAVFDRLPTAELISEDELRSIFEAELYGIGIISKNFDFSMFRVKCLLKYTKL